MSAHTPGPWKHFYKQKYNEWQVSLPLPDSSMRLALFEDGVRTDNPEADARLIAAAPAMLSALQVTSTNLSSLIAAQHHDAMLMTEWRSAVDAAIALATEEPA